MIQAVAQRWPEFAFWLVTGIEDFAHGHTGLSAPDGSTTATKRRERTAARDYFVKLLERRKWMEEGIEPDASQYAPGEDAKGYFQRELYELQELRKQQESAIEALMARAMPKEMAALEAQGTASLEDK